ncbi:glycosyltransferase family 4 protein [Fodinibius sp.]|uniref:glycosyltransferase family 4 protein n=1 Tax=Fodinibius sp. TaxID=1872440 RepID=UPI00356177A6
MRIAILSTIAWRTPPRHYGPWESVASNLTEELVARGHDVTLYATGDSVTNATLKAVCPYGYEEDSEIIPKVWESLHISNLFEEADQFDIIHNHFDFLPLTYSSMTKTPIVTTIHGFSSPGILPVYRKYDDRVYYVSISDADRAAELHYTATVHHGINIEEFHYQPHADDYLLFFGRIHPDKGVREAVEIALSCDRPLIIAGIIQDRDYYKKYIKPHLTPGRIEYVGSVGPDKRSPLLGNAAAMLHPIHFEEPFGLSVVESMACGTPVIAFNKGSMPELIDHGQNGFLVENVSEAVEAIKKLKAIRRSDCREHVKRFFTVDHMVDNYVDTYNKILSTKESNIEVN